MHSLAETLLLILDDSSAGMRGTVQRFYAYMLQVAMIFAFATFQWIEAGVLAFIVGFNTFLGFSQEYKSEKTLAALQKLSTSSAVVCCPPPSLLFWLTCM